MFHFISKDASREIQCKPMNNLIRTGDPKTKRLANGLVRHVNPRTTPSDLHCCFKGNIHYCSVLSSIYTSTLYIKIS